VDRRIQGAGTPPDDWPAWMGAQAQPRPLLEPAANARLVVVAPHPDDEVLMCGGLLRRHLGRGGRALVIAATDGEASHRGVHDMPPDALRRIRRHESLQGLALLGLGANDVSRLALPDGGIDANSHRLCRRLMALLSRGDWVVTTWRLDGHPDHEATGEVSAKACATVGCRLLEAPVWMWHWGRPGQAGIPWHRLHALDLDPAEALAKRHALDAHQSQLTPRGEHLPPVLDTSIVQRSAWPHEYFFTDEAA
jgi:LmbE family N-acetylglucosaminyl deacetylase